MISFDANFYATNNQDVVAAIVAGTFAGTLEDHFNQFGFKELRDPSAAFDTSAYLTANPDVLAAGVNALDHFVNFGAAEGRLPGPIAGLTNGSDFDEDTYLAANTDVAAAIPGTFASGYQHWVLFGQFESRSGAQNDSGVALTGSVAGVAGTPGDTFTLTVGVDEGTKFTGTAADDTFRAVTKLSLEDADILDGAGGNDVLNISDGGMGGTTVAPVIKNIERINNADTDKLDMTSITGADQVWSSAAGDYTNAMTSTIFGAEKGSTAVTVDHVGAATSAKLAINNTDAADDATFTLTDAATITDVDVLAVKGNKADATLDAALDALKNVTASGDGEVTVISAEATIESVSSASNTGGLTFDASGATALKTMTGGAGKDVFTVADQTKLTIDLGAGNDAVTLGGANAEAMVTLGAGNDKLTFLDLDNMTDVTEAGFAATIIKVADFNGADDTIDVTNANIGARDLLTNVELADIADEATLFAAVTKAATFTDTTAESYSTFVYGGNTYIYNDSSDTQLLAAGDGLVELTGFTGDFDASSLLA